MKKIRCFFQKNETISVVSYGKLMKFPAVVFSPNESEQNVYLSTHSFLRMQFPSLCQPTTASKSDNHFHWLIQHGLSHKYLTWWHGENLKGKSTSHGKVKTALKTYSNTAPQQYFLNECSHLWDIAVAILKIGMMMRVLQVNLITLVMVMSTKIIGRNSLEIQ